MNSHPSATSPLANSPLLDIAAGAFHPPHPSVSLSDGLSPVRVAGVTTATLEHVAPAARVAGFYSRPLRVLVACEFSGVVRRAFRALGHEAWSCGLLPSEDDSPWHIRDDIFHALSRSFNAWDLMICHPPCTDLAVSGARHFPAKIADGRQDYALDFVRALMAANIEHIALENPISIISSKIRKPDQIIQPWQFGHGEVKATCLWLKGLPKLTPTDIVAGREARVHKLPPGPNRWKERSRTLAGVAAAMAAQWGQISETLTNDDHHA